MGMTTQKPDGVSVVLHGLAIILCGISLITALPTVFAQTTNSDDDQVKISNLLKEIKQQSQFLVERDTNGNVVSLSLYSQYADERRLEVVSKIHSLRTLHLQNSTDKLITKNGISHLVGMTNLQYLSLACGGLINPGVLQEICKIRGLHELHLGCPIPQKEEYSAITNLQLLTTLRLGVGTNFGDYELTLLTNLHNLKTLEISGWRSGFTSEGIEVLKHRSSLTRLEVSRSK